jgi:CheY-like chemotaxis protein
MDDFKEQLGKHGYGRRFQRFQDLMRHRVNEILLVSSLYDSFILEEDGRLHEMLLSEYIDHNLSHAPGLTRVSTGDEAIGFIREQGRFDLIITTMNLGDMNAFDLARRMREEGLRVPIVLLTYDNRELAEMSSRHDMAIFDKVFVWHGDFRILIAIIKYIEDRRNLDHDTNAVGVQSIIVIEDNISFYSSYLPMIYTELIRHTQSVISEGVNISHKLTRMRARPKILLCSSYEEAWDYYKRYEDCILGVIADIEFPREGKPDPEAGIRFARAVKASHFDIPILLQSDNEEYREVAKELDVSFLLKTSPLLLHELSQFMEEQFSFGDFVFRMPDNTEVARATDLRSLEKALHSVPDESLLFHARRNHFSNWLKARTEFWLAHKLRPQKVTDYDTVDDLRQDLIRYLRDFRRGRQLGQIADFDVNTFDLSSSFARIGGGSLGGKARGLGFVNSLLSNYRLRHRFGGVQIGVPACVVIGTDVFDEFLDSNQLRDFAIRVSDDKELYNRFLKAPLPRYVREQLEIFLEVATFPLAVRSSSLLEDSKYQPFAGIYKTYMLPNNHQKTTVRMEELTAAIKRVFASTFSDHAKRYIRATQYRLEEEKMAVIIQKMVGNRHGNRFYPDFSGVARSHNFYPTPPMKAGDGIASVALGLGKTVVEGGLAVRFCPKYPRHLIQFSDIESTLNSSQKDFYALELEDPAAESDHSRELQLVKYSLDVAEEDSTLAPVASTYSPENDAIYDGVSRAGSRVVTFAPILKNEVFPLSAIIQTMLELGSFGMSTPVEMEFAVNYHAERGSHREFALLQMRPLVKSREFDDVDVDDVAPEEAVCQCPQVLGNGLINDIHDIVVVDLEAFDRSRSREVAREVAAYNAQLSEQAVPYVLVGVGRWGSSDPWLGIPVAWDEISGARVIIETGFKDFRVVPSQGSHFFQNITSFMVGYFTVNSYSNEGFVDWEWLLSQQPIDRKTYVRHLRFDKPVIVKMNGHSHRGVILKPGADGVPKNAMGVQAARIPT